MWQPLCSQTPSPVTPFSSSPDKRVAHTTTMCNTPPAPTPSRLSYFLEMQNA